MSNITSPPTTPEADNVDEKGADECAPDSTLSQAQEAALLQLAYRALHCPPPAADPEPTAPRSFGTLPPSSPQSATSPSYLYPPPSSGVSHDQPQRQYASAVVASGHGEGNGMQGSPNIIGSPHFAREGEHFFPNRGVGFGMSAPSDGSGNLSEAPTSSNERSTDQSADKKHPCDFPGCGKAFGRPYNLREHVAKVHNRERPWVCSVDGCRKATEGYCRRADLNNHLFKKHGIIPSPVPAHQRRSRAEAPSRTGTTTRTSRGASGRVSLPR
ncbi:hypothetical protein OH77DRAFT_284933 [Trametes cingulata]|nr:hypothetical protein OH77DRAFT_284933 [Trametes cingulata]